MGEHAQVTKEREGEDRAEERPVHTEHDRERRDVADQQMLDHVRVEEALLAERVDRRGERDDEEQKAAEEPCLACERNRTAAAPERARAPCVGDGCEEEDGDLKRFGGEAAGGRGEEAPGQGLVCTTGGTRGRG